ncbi:MAG: hypothetical protein HOG05_00400, partial [Bacteroidetes bacterium]|nr:hypothetical protein [Bacteroidota bacterium]
RLLKESMNIISDLVNEVTLKIDQDKIELIAIDPANVAMIDFKLLSSAFVEYTVEKPEELAINLDHLKSVLKRAKPTDKKEVPTPAHRASPDFPNIKIKDIKASITK